MRARALLAHACLKAAPHRGLSLVSADGASPSQSAPFRRFRQFFYFAAGAYFGAVYLVRGFGVVAATHAVYDIITAFLVAGGVGGGAAPG